MTENILVNVSAQFDYALSLQIQNIKKNLFLAKLVE